MHMSDERRQPDWRYERLQQDLQESRSDMKMALRELNVTLSELRSTMQANAVTMPLTYVSRTDLTERLKDAADIRDARMRALDDQLKRMQSLMTQLIFAILGALITGGLALLAEIFRLINGTKPV